ALVSLNLTRGHQSRMYQEGPCVRCAKCVDRCPVSILPNVIGAYCRKKRFTEAIEKGLFLCIDCGLCSYVCPARIPLGEIFKEAKSRGGFRARGENT
ncbi:MAG: 4Fe-4S dicluster domain-containing protein, partial [Pseudomonadota bacterium]